MTKRKNNRIVIIILVIAVLAMAVLAVVKARKKPRGEEVEVTKVELRTIKETVTASGKVFPEKEVKISSDVSGEVVELFVEEGDSVKAGQVLARIDPEAYESSVERGRATLNNSKSSLAMQKSSVQSSKAQVEQIQAQLSNAEKIHERNEQLLAEGIISTADFEASEANLNQLQANLRSAQAQYQSAINAAEAAEYSVKSTEAALKELQTNLNRTTISAPTDGIVSKLNVEQGERVVGTIQMAGTEMMRIANFNSMEVQVEVSENDILRVSLGDSVDIEVDAYLDDIFKGVVTEIANSAANTGTGTQVVLTSDQVTNFVVKIRLDSRSYTHLEEGGRRIPFRPGMSASVDIYTESAVNVPAVPIQAVTVRDFNKDSSDDPDYEEDEREVVFVFEGDTARMAEVKTGIQDNEYIQIVDGLSEGEEIIEGPYAVVSRRVEQGDPVSRKSERDRKTEEKE